MSEETRRKLVEILRAPVPGTRYLERKSGQLIQASGRCLYASVKWLWWASPGFVALLAVWIVGGNFLAAQQEKEIEQAWEEFAAEWPETEMNDSAIKLAELASDLGTSLGIGARYRSVVMANYLGSHPDFTVSETAPASPGHLQQEFDNYLDNQIANPSDEIEALPENLRDYLANNAATLEAIRTHLLEQELPKRATFPASVILEKHIEFIFDASLGLANLQKILQVYSLEQKIQGQHQTAEEILEASWTLNQLFSSEQSLLSQLIALIVSRWQIGTMRKLDNLSSEWQDRLVVPNYRKSFLKSLESEIFIYYGLAKDMESSSYQKFEELMRLSQFSDSKVFARLSFWFRPLLKPYHRFSVVNSLKKFREELTSELQKPTICPSEEFVRKTNQTWWNLYDLFGYDFGEFMGQERKVLKNTLAIELTQKVLQVKSQAKKQGNWPESLPNLDSEVCPGETWIYKISKDGTISLSFSHEPGWIETHVDDGYPPLKFMSRKVPNN